MAESTKVLLGWLGVAVTLIAYLPYFWDLFSGKTKPHAFSWLIWGILTGIGFASQLAGHGGPGAWISGISSVILIVIFVLACFCGERKITRADWTFLFLALSAIPLWIVTETPLWSVLLVILIDLFGFVPTLYKSYHQPFQETALTYGLNSLKYVIGLLALSNYSVVTAAYPSYNVITQTGFAAFLYWRRAQLAAKPKF